VLGLLEAGTRATEIAVYRRRSFEVETEFEVRIDDDGKEAISVGSARETARRWPGAQARSDGGQEAPPPPLGSTARSWTSPTATWRRG